MMPASGSPVDHNTSPVADSGSARGSDRGGAERAGRHDLLQIAAIAAAGGVFSGLFGVGGGAVMVPLLVLWRGLSEKLATGTSLLAIVVVAAYAVTGHAIFGSVDVVKGIFIGVPAIVGVIAGTALQQRLSDRLLAGMFAVLMIVIAAIFVFD